MIKLGLIKIFKGKIEKWEREEENGPFHEDAEKEGDGMGWGCATGLLTHLTKHKSTNTPLHPNFL